MKFDSLIGVLVLTILIKAVALWVGSIFIEKNSGWINHTFVDIWSWLDFLKKSLQGLIPYVDFSKEYPVGAGMLYWLIAKAVGSSDSTLILHFHAKLMSVVDVVTAGVLYQILREANLKRAFGLTMLYVCIPTGLVLLPVRFEGVVILISLLGYWLHRRGHTFGATAVWSLGCWIKWFPAVFIAVQEIRKSNFKHLLKSGLIFATIAVILNLPFIWMGLSKHGNIHAWTDTYFFHVNRPLYWDTVLGVMHLWWGEFSWERYASLGSIIAMVGVLLAFPRLKFEAKSILVMLIAIVFNRVYSTQFQLWIYPMILFMLADEEDSLHLKTLLFLFIAWDFCNILVYPFTFTQAIQEMGGFGAGLAIEKGRCGTIVFSQLIFLRAILIGCLFICVIFQSYSSEQSRK